MDLNNFCRSFIAYIDYLQFGCSLCRKKGPLDFALRRRVSALTIKSGDGACFTTVALVI